MSKRTIRNFKSPVSSDLSLEDKAREYLSKKSGFFKKESELDDLSVESIQESPIGFHVRFKQHFENLPVFNGGAEVHINKESEVFLAHDYFVSDIDISLDPTLTSEEISKIVKNDFINSFKTQSKKPGKAPQSFKTLTLREALQPELGLFQTEEGKVLLVYKVTLDSESPIALVEYIIDANSGEIEQKRNLIQFADGEGLAFDPNPVYSLNDNTLRDNTGGTPNADAPAFSPAYDFKTLLDLEASVAPFTLTGPYVKLEDIEAPANVPPSIADPDDFLYFRDESEFEEVMVYFHVDRNQRYIQSLGFSTINNRQHRVDAHGTTADNSFYSPNPAGAGYLAFGDGGVDDAEDADVILHEYGHSIQDNSSKGKYLFGGEAGAMGEGFGDYWAASNTPTATKGVSKTVFDQACVMEWDAVPNCLRRVDGTKHYPEDIVPQVHQDGEIWSAALWDIFQVLGKSVTDKIVLQSHFLVPNNPKFKDGALALLDADAALFSGINSDVICEKMTDRGILDGCIDIDFVIDDTGSMGGEINAVKAGLQTFIDFLPLVITPPEPNPLIELTTFKDNVTSRIVSRDLDAVKSAVGALFASGGGGCPEYSLSGLYHAASRMKDGGQILFATDASSNPSEPVVLADLISLLISKGIRVHTMLTGNCRDGSFKTSLEKYSVDNNGNPINATLSLLPPGTNTVDTFASISLTSGGTLNVIPEAKSNATAKELLTNMIVGVMKGAVVPTVIGANPNSGARGITINIEVNGSNTNFDGTSAVTISGTDITINTTTVNFPTSITLNISISPTADMATLRDITVETTLGGDTEIAEGIGIFRVTDVPSGPTVTSVFPSDAEPGATLDVSIFGANTSFDGTSLPNLGLGITVNSVAVKNTGELTANITIEDTASIGFRDVSVTTGTEFANESVLGPFLVRPSAPLIPLIQSIDPVSGGQGTSVTLNIVGSNTSFVDGTSQASFSGTGITVTTTTVTDSTHATATIQVAGDATLGFRDIRVSTDAETAVKIDSFSVKLPPPPPPSSPGPGAPSPVTPVPEPVEINVVPSVPQLVSPEDEAIDLFTTINFRWKKSTDSDGDELSYDLLVCEDDALTVGCTTDDVASITKTSLYAGLSLLAPGVLFGVVFLKKDRRKKLGLFFVMIMATTIFSAAGCSSGGGGAGIPADEISKQITGLSTATTYHWKVTAKDGKGGTSESEIRSFTTL